MLVDGRRERLLRAVAAVASVQAEDLGALEAADRMDDVALAGLERAASALVNAVEAAGRPGAARRVRDLLDG